MNLFYEPANIVYEELNKHDAMRMPLLKDFLKMLCSRETHLLVLCSLLHSSGSFRNH